MRVSVFFTYKVVYLTIQRFKILFNIKHQTDINNCLKRIYLCLFYFKRNIVFYVNFLYVIFYIRL